MKTLQTFCQLRTKSIAGQLDGTIPSTEEEQAVNASALVDASSISLSDMGTMDRGSGFDMGKLPFPSGGKADQSEAQLPAKDSNPTDSKEAEIPAMNLQPVEILRQGPPERLGENGFPGKNLPAAAPVAVNKDALLLTALSLAVLLAGILTALLYCRRKK